MTTRDDVVRHVLSCLGTPFHHQGRKRGVGLDCIGLLRSVADEFGLTSHDLVGYSRYPDGVTLCRELDICLERISVDEAAKGDVLVFWIHKPELPTHAGVLISRNEFVHTYADARRVVRHRLTTAWRRRIHSAYRFPGLE